MSDIGNGWIPALINDQTELDFIRESQRGLSNNHDYYIGGTTRGQREIDLSGYRTTNAGRGESYQYLKIFYFPLD